MADKYDALSVMQQEINTQRSHLQKSKTSKYVRRKDIEAAMIKTRDHQKFQAKESMEDKEIIHRKRQAFDKQNEIIIDDNNNPLSKRIRLSSSDSDNIESNKDLLRPREEVILGLRELGYPITLFGESDEQRQLRLRLLGIDLEERQQSSNLQSDSHKLIQQEVEKEIFEATAAALEKKLINSQEGDDTIEEKYNSINNVSSTKEHHRKYKYAIEKTRNDFQYVEDYILYFFKRALFEWEEELNKRPDHVKKTALGKHAAATQKQTRQYIKPLLKLLKKKALSKEVLVAVESIVNMCSQREYVRANDLYVHMAIGNAPWPMGVTMVGIHERSGREKLFDSGIAHILNDETQRKYIQSIKRLMTFVQHKRPNQDFSKNIG